jgi:hypothetical protein
VLKNTEVDHPNHLEHVSKFKTFCS